MSRPPVTINHDGEEYVGKKVRVRLQAYITGTVIGLRDEDATNNLIFQFGAKEIELRDDDGVVCGYAVFDLSEATGCEVSTYEICEEV
jgi:hypothetical protein